MVRKDQKEIQALMANQDWTVKMESMERWDLLVLKAFKVWKESKACKDLKVYKVLKVK